MKGADRALGGCRSSIDLLQDRSLSNAPSSPLSRPSKSNLEHERTYMRTHRHIHRRNSVPSPPGSLSLTLQARAARRESGIGKQRPDPGPDHKSHQHRTGQNRHRQLQKRDLRRWDAERSVPLFPTGQATPGGMVSPWPKGCGGRCLLALPVLDGTSQSICDSTWRISPQKGVVGNVPTVVLLVGQWQ